MASSDTGNSLLTRKIASSSLVELLCISVSTPLIKYPFYMRKYGVVNGTLVIILIGLILVPYSIIIFMLSSIELGLSTYNELHNSVLNYGLNFILNLSNTLLLIFSMIYNIDLSLIWIKDISPLHIHAIYNRIGLLVLYSTSSVLYFKKRDKCFFKTVNFAVACILVFSTFYESLNLDYKKISNIKLVDSTILKFDSFGLVFLCFSQAVNGINILNKNFREESRKRSLVLVLINGIIVTSVYITVGILGYYAYLDCEVNWFGEIKNDRIKYTLTVAFLLFNTILFSKSSTLLTESNMNVRFISSYPENFIAILPVILNILEKILLSTKLPTLLIIICGCTSILICPSIIFLRSNKKRSYLTILTSLFMGIGIIFCIKSVYELINLIF